MVLARPIPLPREPRRFLLQRDRRIPLEMVPRLRELGIAEVWVRYRPLEFLEDWIDEGLGERQREIYARVRQSFDALTEDVTPGVSVEHFRSSISELFDFLRSSRCGNLLLQKLDAFDNYLTSHSANVCYLALLLGMRLDRYLIGQRPFKTARDAKDIQLLGLGCLLHDVGKIRVPREILEKPGPLTPEEMEIIKQHPRYGYEMVKGRVPAPAADVVLNHHQRFNGEGYPRRRDRLTGELLAPLQGTQISIFSRIACMVDVYDAATTKRCYSRAKLPVQVLHEMQTRCRGFFDPVVEQAFYQIVPAFPIGQIVELSNGAEAVVVDFIPARPTRPKVQCIKDPAGYAIPDPALEEIDLALHDDLYIAKVDGQDVTPFQSLPCQTDVSAQIAP